MKDKTEPIRRKMVADLNVGKTCEQLEALHGTVYNTAQVSKVFCIEGFMAPFCQAIERETEKKCLLMFQDSPRFYWFDSYA